MTGRLLQDTDMSFARLVQHLDEEERLFNTGSWEWDIASHEVIWSVGLFRIFGLSPDVFQPTYSAFLERVHPDDRSLLEEKVRCAIDGTEDSALDYRIVLPDGSVRIVNQQVKVEFSADGQAMKIIGAVQDVLHLRAAEAASRQSQEMLASMLKISPEAIVVANPATRVLAFSAGAESIFGYGAEEVIGLGVEHLIPVRFRQDHHRHVERFAAGERPSLRMHERSEIVGLRKNGEEFPAEASLAKLKVAGGFAFVIVLRDLSDQKAAELRLIEARDQAEKANLAKSTFLANMSHEIRTPLNGILGVAGALAQTELSIKQLEMVKLIETSGRALEGLLSDILDLAKVDAGRMSVRSEPFDLKAVVQDTFALFRARAAEKGIGFRMEIAEEAGGHFRGDDLKIRQILSNLLSNALKFTDQGEVRLSVAAHHGGEDDHHIQFVVEDTGIGFAPGIERSLFERFEQADASLTRRFGGTGLGLAISKSLVTLMGGTISASSAPGRGATFMFELPMPRVAAGPVVDTVSGQAAAPISMTPMRILLAEDHPINRLVVEYILEALPVELTCVENGQQAVEATEAQPFELIFMDMQMPVMDGLTAIRLIRAQETAAGASSVPICVLTANALSEHRQGAEIAGADAFLTKPIDAGALIALVLEVAAGRVNRLEESTLSRPTVSIA
jgi:PAS domain S-box-containing protein